MFAWKENMLLGYSPHRSFEDSPKFQNMSSDTDFSDVFGGPPRRFSLHEVRTRYSLNETIETEEEEAVSPRSPWFGFDEKPVYGAESGNRRQVHHPSDDFFVDIFRGDESRPYSSPRRNNRDPFGSNPSSRTLSPARPLPPQAEHFSTSLPAQFGLPSKLTNAMELPVFASANHNLYKSKDGNSNGTNISFSRFSSQASELMDEMRNGGSCHHQSPISHEVSHCSEESAIETKSDVNNKEDKPINDSESLEAPASSNQFHFSFYRWAGKGVPLLMPRLVGNRLRSKERSKHERCSSTNGRLQFDRDMEEHVPSVNDDSLLDEMKDQKPEDSVKETKKESINIISEKQPDIHEPKCHETSAHAIPFSKAVSSKKAVEESISYHVVDSGEKSENAVHVHKEQGSKPEVKPLCLFLDDNAHGKGEDSAVKIVNVVHNNANSKNSVKQASAKRMGTNQPEVTRESSHRSTSLKEDSRKSATKGKVGEFVKIFNQETNSKSKDDFDIPSQSSRWKGRDINGKENEMNNVTMKDEKVAAHNKRRMPDTSFVPDTSFKGEINTKTEKVKQDLCSKRSSDKKCSRVTSEKNPSLFSDYAEVKLENRDNSFEGYFVVKELSHAPDKDLRTVGDFEDIKALDAKIQQWSNGRKGNIWSLLSTLQYVLWPGSGWKPAPLVDIIEAGAVKRAYQKALLCLHPDKLQQKGAGSDQKYIAEKVFDILQEAWDHFNSLGAI